MNRMNLLYIGSTLVMLTLIVLGAFYSIGMLLVGILGFILDTYAFIKVKKSIKELSK
jgi:hypothetical protein